MILYELGWFNSSRTCHVASSWIARWCDVISVSSYIFPWAHHCPDISIHRTRDRSRVDGVRSCLAKEPISRSQRVSAFSFDHFLLRYLCLNLPVSSLNRDSATMFYRGEGNYNSPFYLSSETCKCSANRAGRWIQKPTDGQLTKSVFMRKPGTSRQGVIMLKSPISLKLGTNVRHRQLTYMVKDQVKMLNSQPSCLLYG